MDSVVMICSIVEVGLTRANLALRDTMATKKKQQAKKSVRPGEYVRSGECTGDASVVRGDVTERAG